MSFLPLNFNNDLLGFLIFSLFGLIGVYFLFQIISEIVKDEDFLSRLLILLSLISINYAFIEMVQTSPISTSLKPTLITQSFLYVLIYLCIKKNFALGSIICGLMILANAKMSWLIFIIFSLWMLVNFKDSKSILKNCLFFIFPLSCALFILTGFDKGNFSERSYLEIIYNRNGNEDLFIYQKVVSLLSFFALITSGWFFIFKFKRVLNSFVCFGFLISSVVSTFGLIYQFFLIEYFPSSSLVLMSFVRNSNLVFIFWMFAFLSLLNSFSLRKASAVLLVFVAIAFSRFELASLTFLVLLSLGMIWSNKLSLPLFQTNFDGKSFNQSITALTLGLFCLLSFYNIYQANQKFSNHFSEYGFQYFGKWTVKKENEDFFRSLIKIKKDENEYLFIDLTKKGERKIGSIHGKIDLGDFQGFDGLLPSVEINTLVQKGKFIGDFGHFYLLPNLYYEHKTRVIFLENLIKELRYETVSEYSLSNLKKYNLKILLDKDLLSEENLKKLNCEVTYGKYRLCSS